MHGPFDPFAEVVARPGPDPESHAAVQYEDHHCGQDEEHHAGHLRDGPAIGLGEHGAEGGFEGFIIGI